MPRPTRSTASRRSTSKLKHDRSRPSPDPEQSYDVHSVHDSSDQDAKPSPPSTRPRPPRSKRNAARTSPTAEVLDLSTSDATSEPVNRLARGNDAEESMEFEDVEVDVSGAPTDANDGQDEEMDLEMEDVDLDAQQPGAAGEDGLRDMYAAAYQEALHRDAGTGDLDEPDDEPDADPSSLPIYKDGKGQHRGVEISMGTKSKKQDDKSEAAKKRAETMPTARDRQSRINAHKLYVLSILAFARIRNKWCNDDALRDYLVNSIPDYMVTKYKAIHPKKVPEQRERVRMFESFIIELTKWWSSRFRLDPRMTAKAALRQPNQDIATGIIPVPGRRIDGWMVESAADREKRHRKERQDRLKKESEATVPESRGRKGKGKAKANGTQANGEATTTAFKPMEITLFAPGTAIRPIYLSLLPPAEPISSPQGLLDRAVARSGSRETSAQLFCALCRSLGIPARLVISVQPMPWSVGASKLANTAVPSPKADKNRPKSKLPSRTARFNTKPDDDLTSDDEDFEETRSDRSAGAPERPKPRGSGASSVDSDSSLSDLSGIEEVESPRNRAARANQRAGRATENLARKAVLTATKSSRNRKARSGNDSLEDGTSSERSSISATSSRVSRGSLKGKGKGKGKGKEKAGTASETNEAKDDPDQGSGDGDDKEAASKDGDYRPAKWRNLDAPLKVEPKAKLRYTKPKALKSTEVAAEDDSDVEPVDLRAAPTVWVEVFSKPYQRWITIDPVRSVVRPSGSRWMEPSATDRQNKLVYVVAVEEDGYARDVTARYTNSLYSRVARLRPPTRAKGEEDWWTKTVRAIHRPQKLDRDAMEDAELHDSANREAMPASVAAYKDHPVYFLEKHLKRDEVVYPRHQVATFQGMPVFRRANVLLLRSSRQWFNEGRVVKRDEAALKWVKSRGYTLANKRAEEQAKAEGREAPNEGLYAEFQTELYVPPPIVDGKVPTNAFGNIDLFVPSMLPKGAAHVPYNGAGKVAKKLGISYAEAITGFEFRKHRGMPKITGIVVPLEWEQAVLDAYWEAEHLAAERESNKKQERAIKAWKKLLNALRIARRVREQYGEGSGEADGRGSKRSRKGGEQVGVGGYEDVDADADGGEPDAVPGGFLVDGGESEREGRLGLDRGAGRGEGVQRSGGVGMTVRDGRGTGGGTSSSPRSPPRSSSPEAAPEAAPPPPPVPSTKSAPDETEQTDLEESSRKPRTQPVLSLSSLMQAEALPANAEVEPNASARTRRRDADVQPPGRPTAVPEKRGRKRDATSHDEEGDGDAEGAEGSKKRARSTAGVGTRRTPRRAVARRGGYVERSEDEGEGEEA